MKKIIWVKELYVEKLNWVTTMNIFSGEIIIARVVIAVGQRAILAKLTESFETPAVRTARRKTQMKRTAKRTRTTTIYYPGQTIPERL